MNNILVKMEDYIRYKNKYGHNKIDKNNKIWFLSKHKMLTTLSTNPLNELFDSNLETIYTINKDINNNYLIKFESDSKQEYRFDLLVDKYNVYHLAFSTSDKKITDTDYETPTNKNEIIEILNRLVWILKDINLDVEYCIGSTGTKKDIIYKYMMRMVSDWEKRKTDFYPLGWGIFFKM